MKTQHRPSLGRRNVKNVAKKVTGKEASVDMNMKEESNKEV